MKFKRIGIAIAAMAMLSACATRPDQIQAAYVSPTGYQSFSCNQLQMEAHAVSSRAMQASNAQEQRANRDAAAMAVGMIVFWPAIFFVGGNGAETAEVSRLKGEMEAIQTAARHKGCPIQFRAV